MNAPFVVLDANSTGGTKFLDEQGNVLAFLKADVFPPVGTDVLLPDGRHVHVERLWLDLHSDDQTAQISVTVSDNSPATAHGTTPRAGRRL
ncbi:hypothetical protein ACX80U_11780 [Arthrobacter sp. TmT3-37]